MKQYTIGTFPSHKDAEKAIKKIHKKLNIDKDEISYIYRDDEGETKEGTADDMNNDTPQEGAQKGAAVGGSIGAIIGLATVAGIVPVIGPIFVAGPLVSALGIAGALGTTVAGGVTGAAAGGLIGALVSLGADEDCAQEYEDRVSAGDVLVAVHADPKKNVIEIFNECNAENIETLEISHD